MRAMHRISRCGTLLLVMSLSVTRRGARPFYMIDGARKWVVTACYISCAFGGCGLIKSDTLIKVLPIIVPPSLVAEGLGIVAFQGARQLGHELPEKEQAEQLAAARRVVGKLLAHDPALAKEAQGWSIHVLDGEARNATAFAGAGILIHRGLIECDGSCLGEKSKRAVRAEPRRRATKPSKRELAKAAALRERVLSVALSHEISHLAQKHFEERLKANSKEVKEVVDLVSSALAARAQRGQLPTSSEELKSALANLPVSRGALAKLILIAGFSIAGEVGGHPFMVRQELSSDCAGVRLMRDAGYDPADALKFWKANSSAPGKGVYATHPSTPDRVAGLSHCIAALPMPGKKTELAALSTHH